MINLKNLTKTQWALIFVFLLFTVLFIYREQIWDSKIGKAKMDIFETLLQDDPEEAKENIKNILDTLIIQ